MEIFHQGDVSRAVGIKIPHREVRIDTTVAEWRRTVARRIEPKPIARVRIIAEIPKRLDPPEGGAAAGSRNDLGKPVVVEVCHGHRRHAEVGGGVNRGLENEKSGAEITGPVTEGNPQLLRVLRQKNSIEGAVTIEIKRRGGAQVTRGAHRADEVDGGRIARCKKLDSGIGEAGAGARVTRAVAAASETDHNIAVNLQGSSGLEGPRPPGCPQQTKPAVACLDCESAVGRSGGDKSQYGTTGAARDSISAIAGDGEEPAHVGLEVDIADIATLGAEATVTCLDTADVVVRGWLIRAGDGIDADDITTIHTGSRSEFIE